MTTDEPQSAPVLPDQQKTVISSGSPGTDSSSTGVGPTDWGRTLEGQRLGHYELREFVGGGGMGVVFRAVDDRLDRIVAVKVLSREQNADAEMVRRFKNEAQNAARLDHENIARVYDVGEDNGWNYIVFEYVEGVNIRDLVRQQGPLPLDVAVRYVLQVAEALNHASRRDVVHRDIKPSNVLVTPDGRAKLVDMGLARLHQIEPGENDLTASGVTLGTFDYISPEQARDPRSADVRSDLYSLGCTFYFMLTGRPPFPEGTVLQKLLSHSGDAPPDPRDERPDLPEEVTAILHTMLAKQPDQRYQQPGQLIGRLLLLADRLGLDVAGRGAAVWVAADSSPASIFERHLPWVIPVAALVVLVFGIDFFWRWSDRGVPNLPRFAKPAGATARREGGAGPTLDAADANHVRDSQKPLAEPSDSGGGETGGSDEAPIPTPDPPGGGHSTTADIPAADEQSALRARIDPAGVGLPEESAAATRVGIAPPATGGERGIAAEPHSSASLAGVPNDGGGLGPDPIPGGSSGALLPPAHPVDPPPARTRVLIVGDSQRLSHPERGEIAVDSLAAASAKARELSPPVEAIELCYDGVRVEKPFALMLAGSTLTLRKGEGFSPVVRFEPVVGDPAEYPRSMIAVTGGELVLEGIQLELDVPRDPPVDRWSLFELQKVDVLRLERCTMTIRNAAPNRGTYHENAVAFFDVVPPPGQGGMISHGGETTLGLVPITLEDCIARGEATLLRAREVLPMRLKWNDGLLVTTERLLVAGGSKNEATRDAYVKLDLDHVTAVVDRGLCLMTNTESSPHQATLDIECDDSIIVVRDAPGLIEQQGVSTAKTFRGQLLVSGGRNFYEGVDIFWRINAARAEDQILELDWKAWRDRWAETEVRSQPGTVQWSRFPPPDTAVDQHTPEDYRLLEHPSNPAFDSRAGFDPGRLPQVPAVKPPADLGVGGRSMRAISSTLWDAR